jgi:hypothetical protein
MKGIFKLIAFSAVILIGCNDGQKEPSSKQEAGNNTAEIKFNTTDIDLGALSERKTIHNFIFHNTGSSPLLISSAGSSCHCVQAKWPQQPVLPGDSAAIEVALDLSDVQQRFIRTLTVESNAKEPVVVLKITGEMKPGVN